MSEELKPCPFCGGAPRKPQHYMMDDYWYMGCYSESHPVIEFKDSSEVAVVNGWNKRAERDLALRERDAARAEAAAAIKSDRAKQAQRQERP